jgi:RNA polymerase sigma-70 factor (ECF subfamily)
MGSADGIVKPGLACDATPRTTKRLRQLVDDHFDFIARSLRRLGLPESEVDDAVQTVFLLAASKVDDIEPAREKAFLFGVAVRIASEARRARRRRDARETAAAATLVSETETPEQIASARQARALLDEILEAMPLEVRIVFALFELEAMKTVQIAKMLEIPQGTVASRLRRGREIFHEHAERLRRKAQSEQAGPTEQMRQTATSGALSAHEAEGGKP